MALRFRDFRCTKCSRTWEELMQKEELPIRYCCGLAAATVIKAPRLQAVKEHYEQSLKKHVRNAKDMEAALEPGSYFPTSFEKTKIKEMVESGMDPTIIGAKPDSAAIQKHAEKALRQIRADGIYEGAID